MSLFCRALLAALLVLLAPIAAAQQLPEGVVRGPSMGGITEYNLQNGLKVLLLPDPSQDTITVNVTYLVGSRHESYGERGMAPNVRATAASARASSNFPATTSTALSGW